MNATFNRLFGLVSGVILVVCVVSIALWADEGLKKIDVPNGGHIVYGSMAGQFTPQTAMGQILHRVSVVCGDRPQIGRLIQNHDGDLLAVFFTVTAKNDGNRSLAGLAIVSAPKTQTAGGALLYDDADRFPSTVNSLFQRLKQEIGAVPAAQGGTQSAPSAQGTESAQSGETSLTSASAGSAVSAGAAVPAAPAQPLHLVRFPDGTGVIGLPTGWNVVHAQTGDVLATGPRGEALRFGEHIGVIDPSNPQSRVLMNPNSRGGAPGDFVAIRFGADPAVAFKSASAQLAQKHGRQAPTLNVTKVQDIPMQGGKNYFMLGDVDQHDGKGQQSFLAQVIMSQPMAVGTWQMMIYYVQAPPQVLQEERATIAQIFPSYSANGQMIEAQMQRQIQLDKQNADRLNSMVAASVDQSDRSTAGMSDLLRGQTVILDTQYNGHARVSDDLAAGLIDANPNRFEYVPTSQYVKGIDY